MWIRLITYNSSGIVFIVSMDVEAVLVWPSFSVQFTIIYAELFCVHNILTYTLHNRISGYLLITVKDRYLYFNEKD